MLVQTSKLGSPVGEEGKYPNCHSILHRYRSQMIPPHLRPQILYRGPSAQMMTSEKQVQPPDRSGMVEAHAYGI